MRNIPHNVIQSQSIDNNFMSKSIEEGKIKNKKNKKSKKVCVLYIYREKKS